MTVDCIIVIFSEWLPPWWNVRHNKTKIEFQFFLVFAKRKCWAEKNITSYKIMHQPITLIYIGKVSFRKTPVRVSMTINCKIVIYSEWSSPWWNFRHSKTKFEIQFFLVSGKRKMSNRKKHYCIQNNASTLNPHLHWQSVGQENTRRSLSDWRWYYYHLFWLVTTLMKFSTQQNKNWIPIFSCFRQKKMSNRKRNSSRWNKEWGLR